jgi:hypothetical protein
MEKSLSKIWQKRNQIIEGIANKLFKKEHVEALAKERMDVCNSCPKLDVLGENCYVIGTHPCCGVCGCSLTLKLRALSDECPEKKWLAVTSLEEALEINDIIKENGN